MNTEHLLHTAPEEIARGGQGLRCLTDPYYFGEHDQPTPAHELISEAELRRLRARLSRAYWRACWRARLRRVWRRMVKAMNRERLYNALTILACIAACLFIVASCMAYPPQ